MHKKEDLPLAVQLTRVYVLAIEDMVVGAAWIVLMYSQPGCDFDDHFFHSLMACCYTLTLFSQALKTTSLLNHAILLPLIWSNLYFYVPNSILKVKNQL